MKNKRTYCIAADLDNSDADTDWSIQNDADPAFGSAFCLWCKKPVIFLINQKQNTDPDCKNRSATLFFIHKTIYSTCPTKKSFSGYSMGSVERRERGAKPRMSPHKFTSSPSRDILATTPWGQWNSVTRFFSTFFQGLIVAVADSIYSR